MTKAQLKEENDQLKVCLAKVYSMDYNASAETLGHRVKAMIPEIQVVLAQTKAIK